ncbi:MAG: two-component regulator propeller domain-containing protein [Bacteroidota bacterium]
MERNIKFNLKNSQMHPQRSGLRAVSRSVFLRLVMITCQIAVWMQAANLTAQQNGLYFEHISQQQGLSVVTVNSILKDRTGFLWFGTEDGLDLYDGRRMHTYKYEEGNRSSISHSAVWSIFEDSEGTIWVGTFMGLNRYDREQDAYYSYFHDEADTTSLSDDYVRAMAEDSQGNLWVGTGRGLNRMDGGSENFTRYLQECAINVLAIDHLGRLWAGTNDGLKVYDSGRDRFMTYDLPLSATLNRVTSLFEDDGGRLWVGSGSSGLYSFDKATAEFKLFPLEEGVLNSSLEIRDIDAGAEGLLWVGSSHGLYRISMPERAVEVFRHDPLISYSLGDNNVKSLFCEPNGFVWIGTISSGINVINPAKKRFNHVVPENADHQGLIGNRIRSFSEDHSGNILIGTAGGLTILDPVSGDFLPLDDKIEAVLDKGAVKTICVDRNNVAWLGVEGSGLIRYDRQHGEISECSIEEELSTCDFEVNVLMEDRAGSLWIGTDGVGVRHFDPSTGKLDSYIHSPGQPGSISNNRIFSITEDHLGDLWFATAGGGINRLNRETGEFVAYTRTSEDSCASRFSYVLSVHEDRHGDIWAGTFGHGLIHYSRKEDRFICYTKNTGLPNNVIYGILEDKKGGVWLSHNQGLSRFDPESGSYTNYDMEDGLQGNEFNANAWYQYHDGTLLFGGNNGFNIFHPDSIVQNRHVPPVVFTSLKIMNRTILPGELEDGRVVINRSIGQAREVFLNHSDREIHFEFSALDYEVPGKNQYRYRLEEDRDEWIDLGNNNSVSFHDLPYGEHLLHVIGSNNDGVWNEAGARITIHVKPPFYSTIAFKLAWILVIFVLAILFFNLRVMMMRRRQRELELMVGDKIREIAKQRDSLEIQNEELESRNRETQEQRDKTYQMARELGNANRSKLQFFTNISHEFRTPLTLIIGYVEKLLDPSSETRKAERVEDYRMIEGNAKKMKRLIDRLMQFRKLTNQQAVPRVSENNLVEVLKRQAMLYKNLAEKKGIRYTFESKQQEIKLWFDPDQIEEVITNLITNAFKFTPDDASIRVFVGHASDNDFPAAGELQLDRPDEYVYFSVEDSGKGITPEEKEHIFERFYQAPQGDAVLGTGLGLHISDMIVKLHQGRIHLKSEPGKGSVFSVILRRGRSHLENNIIEDGTEAGTRDVIPEEEIPLSQEEAPEASVSQKTIEHLSKKDLPGILLIEDHAELRRFITEGMEAQYNVYGAESGEQALNMLEEADPDVIISDVMLTGEINGFDFTEKIKDDLSSSHIPVIMLTALDSVDQKVLGIEKGADIYMTKPFSIRELKAYVDQLVQSRATLKKKFRDQAFLVSDELKVSDLDESFIHKTIRIIESNMLDPEFNVPLLCEAMNMSQTKLYRKLKALTDMTITDFIREIRMRRAAALIRETDKNISEIAYAVGFNDPNYFRKCFKAQYKVSPSNFAREHKQR